MFDRVLRWLRGNELPPELRPDRTRVVPRVRNVSYVEHLARSSVRERDVVPVEPLVGELIVAYGFDRPTHYQMLTLRDLEALRLTKEELRPLGLENALRIAGGGFHGKQTGPIFEIVHPLATTTLLVPTFWEQLGVAFGGELVVGVPRNDVVIACAIEDTDTVGLLAAIVTDDVDGPPTSPDLLIRVDGRWALLEETDD